MARCGEGVDGGLAAGSELAAFRRELHGCFTRRADALFELGDAVLAARGAVPLPFLSEELSFRRSHGMIYQGLAEGRADEEALRDLLVRYRPAGWPCVFGIDASVIGRPWAVTSPGREFHYHSCAGHAGGGDPVIKGWAWQWLSQLSFGADSWTAPQDVIGVGRDDVAVTAGQILAHAARLRAAGETRIPLYVLDAGYDEAPITWELRDHLDKAQILVRVRNDRVMYRDPEEPEPGRPGRPRRHARDRFGCADPGTWGEPGQVLIREDPRYGLMTVMSWGGLHPKLACRGHFEGMDKPPVIRCHLIRITVEHLSGGRVAPGPLWLWWTGPGQPDLDLCTRSYLHRFDLEHTYRFAKSTLGWHKAALRTPAQFGRWTWIIITAITQLRLARALARDHRHAWERRSRPGRLTPGRVRRDFPRLAQNAGTPASPPKPSRAGPGRPKGRTSTPAPRYDVIKKAA